MFRLCMVFLMFALLVITGHVQQVAGCQEPGQLCDVNVRLCCRGRCIGHVVGVCSDD
nr:venom polypeptide precursor [Doratifera vulnerans]